MQRLDYEPRQRPSSAKALHALFGFVIWSIIALAIVLVIGLPLMLFLSWLTNGFTYW